MEKKILIGWFLVSVPVVIATYFLKAALWPPLPAEAPLGVRSNCASVRKDKNDD